MALQLATEKWSGEISEVIIGATKDEGGSRKSVVRIGGENTLPFLFNEGKIPNPVCVAFEVWDTAPSDWPECLWRAFGKSLNDSLSWAKKCVEEYKAKILCVRLQSAHPDFADTPPEACAKFIAGLLNAVDVPLVIIGCGDDAKDNLVLPAVSEAAKGERCLIGSAVQDNYKTLVAALSADGHNIIAESPIDINIAKQLNILISDTGFALSRIVINPTIGALGYGLEYAYSIMERARLAALSGDKTVASPFICFVGQEAWKAKEAKSEDERQGIIWEMLSAAALIQAGAGLLVMRHPVAVEKVNKYIERLFQR
ncbi:MAG: acetyl-CoA decarbonylase/synthase complex subunit delta [Candidatus Omnitrophica bacterium]|nr:acetyl-CoA decarbonylase/synthase complex subunit delta [Candidatus Omnitrophota bacterium]